MININSDKTLKVLLPNLNKALAEAIKSASVEQLTELGKQKDIKGVLASLFDDKINSDKSDKIILDILKNAPVFKKMGSFSKDFNSLKKELKSKPIPKEVEVSLTKFIKTIDNINPKILKSQITNSGVFLESKLLNPTSFKEIFKEITKEMKTLLQKSPSEDARKLEHLLKPLTEDKNIPSNTKEITPLAKDIVKIVNAIKTLHEKVTSAEAKELEPIIETLKKVIKPEVTQNRPIDSKLIESNPVEFKVKDLTQKMQTLYEKVEQSNLPQKMKLLSSIEKVITSLRSTPLPEPTPIKIAEPQIPKTLLLKIGDEIKEVVDLLPTKIDLTKIPKDKELEPIIETLKKVIKPEVAQNSPIESKLIESSPIEFKVKDLTQKMQTLYEKVEQSNLPQKMKLLSSIEKVITSLRSIPLPEPTPIKIVEPQIPKTLLLRIGDEIKEVVTILDNSTIKVDDPIVSKEMNILGEKLKSFTKPDISKIALDENIVNDAKANLLRLSEEIKQNPQLQNGEIEKLVDKLTLQVDYFQLYSHLNNSSSLYFPFVWDQLEDGAISIKKGKKDKFYCEINLNLKDHGELKLMLTLYNKNQINLHTYSQSSELKDGMREDLEILHSTFKDANLILREIRFFNINDNKTDAYNEPLRELDVGFEVKI